MTEDLPHNWEGGEGSSSGSGADRTFTHWFTNYDPENVSQPADEDKRKILELEVYHDAGNNEYYALLHEAVQSLMENGDVEETVQRNLRKEVVVEVMGGTGRTSPGHIAAENHEEAEEKLWNQVDKILENHY